MNDSVGVSPCTVKEPEIRKGGPKLDVVYICQLSSSHCPLHMIIDLLFAKTELTKDLETDRTQTVDHAPNEGVSQYLDFERYVFPAKDGKTSARHNI